MVLTLVVFAGSFLGTVYSGTARQVEAKEATEVGRWLGLGSQADQSIEAKTTEFSEQARVLHERLSEERMKLAAMFDDANATDEQLRQQVEAVIEAHNRRERHIAEHLISLRGHLNSEQQKQLFELCAKGIRKCCRGSCPFGTEVQSKCPAASAPKGCPQATKSSKCGGCPKNRTQSTPKP